MNLVSGQALRSLLLVANILLAGFVVLAEAEVARAEHQPEAECAVDERSAVAVPGEGVILVRWFGTRDQSMDGAPVAGQAPSFKISRSEDGIDFKVVATTQRASSEGDAASRLTYGGVDHAALLLQTVKELDLSAYNASTASPEPLLTAMAFLEQSKQEMARFALAGQSWRAAWAFGLGWLDTMDLHTNATYHYQVSAGSLPDISAPPVLYSEQPGGPDGSSLVVEAQTIEKLPAPEVAGSDDAGDWSKFQRRQWVDRAVGLRWSEETPGSPCQPAEPGPWVAGYYIHRRLCAKYDSEAEQCADEPAVVETITDHHVFPAEPTHEYQVDPQGKAISADSEYHIKFDAHYVDRSPDLKVGSRYCYSVSKLDLLGQEGSRSGEACAVVLETIPPGAPSDFRLQLVENEVTLEWGPAKDDGVISKYEVWRTALLRQDWLPPDPADPAYPDALPPPPLQAWKGTAADRWSLLDELPGNVLSYTDTDPEIVEGKHFWYRVRAFDTPPSGPSITLANGALYAGNPGPFTRPLSLGPRDLTAPKGCLDLATPGLRVPFQNVSCADGALPMPQTQFLGAQGSGCIQFPEPIPADARRIYWFQSEDATADRLHLARVLENLGQTTFCNPVSLPYAHAMCVRLQLEDANGNRGVMNPVPETMPGEEPCYYPSFSEEPYPPPPTPALLAIGEDASAAGQVVLTWRTTEPTWLHRFWAFNLGSDPEAEFDEDGCPEDLTAAPFEVFVTTDPRLVRSEGNISTSLPQKADIAYWVIMSESLSPPDGSAALRACSHPLGYQRGVGLATSVHPHLAPEAGGLCLKVTRDKDTENIFLRWGYGSPPSCSDRKALPTGAAFMVYRSVFPDRGFVAITPPFALSEKEGAWYDPTGLDGRFYYQVAWVGYLDAGSSLPTDGEVLATTQVARLEEAPAAWPPTPASGLCPEPPNDEWGDFIQHIYFGTGPERMTMEVCYHRAEEISFVNRNLDALGDVGEPVVAGVDTRLAQTSEEVSRLSGAAYASVRPTLESVPWTRLTPGSAVLGAEEVAAQALPERLHGPYEESIRPRVVGVAAALPDVAVPPAASLADTVVGSVPGLSPPAVSEIYQSLPPTLADVVAQAPKSPVPVKLSGAGRLLLDIPVGEATHETRRYPFYFDDLTVLVTPAGPPGEFNAQVLAGAVSHEDAVPKADGSHLFPFRWGSEAAGHVFRAELTSLTLDGKGAAGDVGVRASDDFRFVTTEGSSDVHPVGAGLPLTRQMTFEGDLEAGTSPSCEGPTSALALEMTTLPLRLVPLASMRIDQARSSPVDVCTRYLRYDGNAGDPPGTDPESRLNSGFLKASYEGEGLRLTPAGTMVPKLSKAGDSELVWGTTAPMGFLVVAPSADLRIQQGFLGEGKVHGPVSVQMSYRSDVGDEPVRRLMKAEFQDGLSIQRNGAMHGKGGSVADPSLSWQNGALEISNLGGGSWQLSLAEVQTLMTVADGGASDDHWERDLLGPEQPPGAPGAAADEPGLNFHYGTIAGDAPGIAWRCQSSDAPPVNLTAKRIDVYLRRSGLTQEVEAAVDINAPTKIPVRGYDAELLSFHALFRDSDEVQSGIRLRLVLPAPGNFSVLLLNATLDEMGCVERGHVPPGTEVTAEAWNIAMAPVVGEFRSSKAFFEKEYTLYNPGQDPSEGDFPHQVLWLLGSVDFPHLTDPTAPEDVRELGFVRFDQPWTPIGAPNFFDETQAESLLPVAPALHLDGFNFIVTQARFSFIAPTSVGSTELAVGQPVDWHAGSLGATPPCAVTCPPQAIYEGRPALPYWGESQDVTVTAFAAGVAKGAFDDAFLGFSEPLHVHRGWTESSEAATLTMGLRYVQKPNSKVEAGAFVGFANDAALGDVATLDFGTIVSTLSPCPPKDASCVEGEPSIQMLTGMAASTGVLKGAMDIVNPGLAEATLNGLEQEAADALTDEIENLASGLASDLQLPLDDAEDYAAYAAAVTGVWDGVKKNCKEAGGTDCYMHVASVMGDQLKDAGVSLDVDYPPALAHLAPFVQTGGHATELLEGWSIGLGEMRSTIHWTTKALGDYQFERLEVTVKFDERSSNRFLTAESVTLSVDREGTVTLSAKGLKSQVLALAPKAVDLDLRFEDDAVGTRFDGGLSIYEITFGTLVVKEVHGVFGAGVLDGGPYMYFGISGQGYSTTDSTTLGLSLFVGTILETTRPILRAHGFGELVDYLEEGDDAEGKGKTILNGFYARAYGQVPILGNGCAASLNGGAEIGVWYFVAPGAPTTFGAKLRVFATGELACLVDVRGDLTMRINVVGFSDGSKTVKGDGQGWAAGGIGFCESATWTDWGSRFWGDGWCFICGMYMNLAYNGKGWDSTAEVDCG